MSRFLITLGLILLAAGLLWPYLGRLGLGRLPGDIVIKRGATTFYFPLMTSIVGQHPAQRGVVAGEPLMSAAESKQA